MNFPKWLDRWIFAGFPADGIDLGVYRLFLVSWLLAYDLPRGLWVAGQPDFLFSPPASFAAWSSGFPGHGTLWALNLLYAGGLLVLLSGRFALPAASVAAIARLSLNTWEYADGKIVHEILPTIALLTLAASGWGKAYGLRDRQSWQDHRRHRTGSWSLTLLAVLVAIAMFTAAWAKFSSGWLQPDIQATQSHLLSQALSSGRGTWLAMQLLMVKSTAFWEFQDWAAVLMEFAFLPALLHRRMFQLVCLAACFFHLGVLLTFDIGFSQNVVVYAAFVPWSRIVPTSEAATRRRLAQCLLVVSTVTAATALTLGRSAASLVGSDGNFLLYVAPAFGTALLVEGLRRQRRQLLPPAV